MAPFVILSLALLVMVLATAGVAAAQLVKSVRSMAATLADTRDRLVPLTEELQSELAVTALEVEHLQGAVGRLGDQRRAQSRARRQRRKARHKRRGGGRRGLVGRPRR
ncbi:MAG: hypothetical protein ACRDU8_10455 [Egibacteraceae bacterium]